jgi:hypothetical protein
MGGVSFRPEFPLGGFVVASPGKETPPGSCPPIHNFQLYLIVTTDLSLLSYLPIASFALAAGGLAIRLFFPSGTATQTLIIAVLIFLVLTCGLLWQQDSAHRKQVRRAADEIVKVIGNDKSVTKIRG